MNKQLDTLIEYILKTLGIPVNIGTWAGARSLPLYLGKLYDFYELTGLPREYLLAVATSPEEDSPVAIRKHLDKIREVAGKDVIYVRESIASWNRKRLIEQKVSFLAPGNQMYLPLVGIDLREYIRLPMQGKAKALPPSTQYLALQLLYRHDRAVWTVTELAKELGLQPMTVKRAFDDLGVLSMFVVEKTGKSRTIALRGSQQEAWTGIAPWLRSPVMKKVIVARADMPEFVVCSGLSALSSGTMLAEPQAPEYALSSTDWKRAQVKRKIASHHVLDADSAWLEIWRYPPVRKQGDRVADPLSVYLSLKDSEDERVQSALSTWLGSLEW